MSNRTTPPVYRCIGRIIHVMRKERSMRQSELATLTGLKQPNLSRIENGVVIPRKSTLKKIAEALDVTVDDLLSESKAQEVEAKWEASLSPKNAGLLFSGKLSPIPLYIKDPMLIFNERGYPSSKEELILQLLPIPGRAFALRVPDEMMEAPTETPSERSFKKGEVVVFADQPVKSGDLGLAVTTSEAHFRKLEFDLPGGPIRLVPLLTPKEYRLIQRSETRALWKLILHIKEC